MNKEYILKNELSELDKLSEIVKEVEIYFSLREIDINPINLMLEEIFTNTVIYGYSDNKEHNIKIVFDYDGQIIEVIFEDDGDLVNPLSIGINEKNTIKTGNVKLHFISKNIDDIQYKRAGNKNIIKIRKKLNA
jgi:anti-sigma regulatory factor (Ser/Thr protein kinase)